MKQKECIHINFLVRQYFSSLSRNKHRGFWPINTRNQYYNFCFFFLNLLLCGVFFQTNGHSPSPWLFLPQSLGMSAPEIVVITNNDHVQPLLCWPPDSSCNFFCYTTQNTIKRLQNLPSKFEMKIENDTKIFHNISQKMQFSSWGWKITTLTDSYNINKSSDS